MLTCASCRFHGCNNPNAKEMESGQFPQNCPTITEDSETSLALYQEEENLKMAQVAADVITQGKGTLSRMDEIILFAQTYQYKTLGLAFCIALSKEANAVAKQLRQHGFAVESVICKNAAIPRHAIGSDSTAIMCNPIGQAHLLNERNCDFNIILGLCVGHDTLFIKHSDAPVTILAVKDRVWGHHPLKAFSSVDS